MTESQVKSSAYNRGFALRMQQLLEKEAHTYEMRKEAMQFLRGLGTAAMDAGRELPGAFKAWRGMAQHAPEMGQGFGETLFGRLPSASQDFLSGNKNMLTGLGAGAAGAAGMKGFDAYEDSRRRAALRQLGIMPRLMLAGQMLFSPEKAIQSMRL